MNPFVRNLLQHFNKNLLDLLGGDFRRHRFLVAVSGGADSFALAELCRLTGMNMLVAHCNFSLRGEESDGDEAEVRNYCEKKQLDFLSKRFATKDYAVARKISVQEAARELRYEWFHDLCLSQPADFILTGHHTDDNIETFFLNLFRGTGPKGLKGIPVMNGNIIRPLLDIEHTWLESFCRISQVSYRTDSSNLDSKYRRNFLRNEILPRLYSQFPGLRDNLTRTMVIQERYDKYVSDRVSTELRRCIHVNAYGVKLELENVPDQALVPFIVRSWMDGLGFSSSDIEDMNRCIAAQKSGMKFITKGGMAVSDRRAIIYMDREVVIDPVVAELREGSLDTWAGKVIIEKSRRPAGPDEIRLSADLDGNRMVIRTRQDGDRIAPLGMDGKKQKLQDIYTNARLDHLEKLLQPVILIDDRIVWIPGLKKSTDVLTEDNNQEGLILRFVRDPAVQ